MTAFFTNQDITEITQASLDKLRQAARESPLKRARICLHHSHNDQVQEMVIAFCRQSYIRPHRHQNKSESFHIIEGSLVVVFFDDRGQVTYRLEMSANGAEQPFLYRLSSSLWHTVLLLSDMVIIHETTTGPFIKAEAEFAPWGPDEADPEAISKFLATITS